MAKKRGDLARQLRDISRRLAQLADDFAGGLRKSPAEKIHPHAQKMVDEGKCTSCERVLEKGEKTRKGVCNSCYMKVVRRAEEFPGVDFWERMYREGTALPPKKGGAKRKKLPSIDRIADNQKKG